MSIAKRSGSLSDVLTPLRVTHHLSDLYTPQGGYLSFDHTKKTWKGSVVAMKDIEGQSQFIIAELCREGLPPCFSLQDRETIAGRINSYFFTKEPFNTASDEGEDEVIRFNSKIKGREFLSNFFPTLIVVPTGDFYPSVECAYHDYALRLFGDATGIPQLEQPGLPSRLSAPVKVKKHSDNLQKERYKDFSAEEKKEIMTELLNLMRDLTQLKYGQSQRLGKLLSDTGQVTLIENSTTDKFFGQDRDGKGNNHLGRILMDVRNFLDVPPGA